PVGAAQGARGDRPDHAPRRSRAAGACQLRADRARSRVQYRGLRDREVGPLAREARVSYLPAKRYAPTAASLCCFAAAASPVSTSVPSAANDGVSSTVVSAALHVDSSSEHAAAPPAAVASGAK